MKLLESAAQGPQVYMNLIVKVSVFSVFVSGNPSISIVEQNLPQLPDFGVVAKRVSSGKSYVSESLWLSL